MEPPKNTLLYIYVTYLECELRGDQTFLYCEFKDSRHYAYFLIKEDHSLSLTTSQIDDIELTFLVQCLMFQSSMPDFRVARFYL